MVASSPSPSWNTLHKPTYYLAGTCLFSLSNLCAQPFILLKRRQQMGLAPTTTNKNGGGGGIFRLLYDIAKTEGGTGLFRSASIAWVPGGARMLYFTVYEHVADFLGSKNAVDLSHHNSMNWTQPNGDDGDVVASSIPKAAAAAEADDDNLHMMTTKVSTYPGWVYGTAGGISTFASQLIMAPYSVISSRLQIATGSQRLSAVSVLWDVVSRPNGVRALWTGYYSAIAQLGPQHATMWAVSTWLQNQLVVLALAYEEDGGGVERAESVNTQEEFDSSSSSSSSINGEYSPSLLARLGTSLCGSFVAIVVTSPLDAVRTHRQIMISHSPLPPPPSPPSSSISGVGGHHPVTVPSSSWSTFVLLYRQQGLRAFTNGIIPRALANCPGMIAMMVGYQYVKQLAEHVQMQQQQYHV